MCVQCDEGIELFRQAIVERDQHSWAEIHRRYRVLMIAWVRQCSAASTLSEHYEDIADQAFARAWSAMNPARFGDFPSLAAILAYLRTCVSTVIIERARAQSTRERTMKRLILGEAPSTEQMVLQSMDNIQLWALVQSLVSSPHDQVILSLNIVLGLPPRLILSRRPDLFNNIDQIYSARRNFIGRLQRNTQLRNIIEAE